MKFAWLCSHESYQPEDLLEQAVAAEQAGFDMVTGADHFHPWVDDRSASSFVWTWFGAVAQATERVELGSAIAYAFGRTPLVLAAEARDLDELAGGRLILGLGTGTRRMQQDWHGLDGEHPASRMEELVPLVRRVLRLHEGPIEHDGRFYRLRVAPTAILGPRGYFWDLGRRGTMLAVPAAYSPVQHPRVGESPRGYDDRRTCALQMTRSA